MDVRKIKKRFKSIGKDVEKLECMYTIGGNLKWYRHYGKQYKVSSKKLKKIKLSYDPVMLLWDIYIYI